MDENPPSNIRDRACFVHHVASMPRSPAPAPKTLRRHVTIPGILADIVRRRREEFGYDAFSPYALELICFDLRLRHPHVITLTFARDSLEVQEALDRELVRQYVPGHEKRGPLMQALFCDIAETQRSLPAGTYGTHADHVIYPAVLHPCIEIRWPEAGYESFSAYLTGLIRYDLMLLGPHRYFNGADTDRALLAALDAETVRTFHANEPKRIRLDDFIEQSAGRPMTADERSAAMRQLATTLRERALRKQKEERKGG
jgi:hypothetical protein